MQKHLLTSSEIVQLLKEEIGLQVTDRRLDDAPVGNQLDTLYKNVLRQQNPPKIVFNNITTFDVQNLIIDRLLTETETGNLTDQALQKFLSGAPTSKDPELRQGLESLNKINKDLRQKNTELYTRSNQSPVFPI